MLSDQIMAVVKNAHLPKYTGLILTDDRAEVSEEIWKLFRQHDGFKYDPSLQCFGFFGGGLLWVHQLYPPKLEKAPKDSQVSRYAALDLYGIVIENCRFLEDKTVEVLRTRLRNRKDGPDVPFVYFVNGVDMIVMQERVAEGVKDLEAVFEKGDNNNAQTK